MLDGIVSHRETNPGTKSKDCRMMIGMRPAVPAGASFPTLKCILSFDSQSAIGNLSPPASRVVMHYLIVANMYF